MPGCLADDALFYRQLLALYARLTRRKGDSFAVGVTPGDIVRLGPIDGPCHILPCQFSDIWNHTPFTSFTHFPLLDPRQDWPTRVRGHVIADDYPRELELTQSLLTSLRTVERPNYLDQPCNANLGKFHAVVMVIEDANNPGLTIEVIAAETELSQTFWIGGQNGRLMDVIGERVKVDGRPILLAYAAQERTRLAPLVPVANPEAVFQQVTDEIRAHSGGMLGFLRDEFIQLGGLVTGELLREQSAMLERRGLQLFAGGFHKGKNAGLHEVLGSLPGAGKQVGNLFHRLFSPIYSSAHGAKLTPAGLIAETVREGKRARSRPGTLAKGHRGVTHLEDFHRVHNKGQLLAALLPILNDGRIADSTVAHALHEAATSVTIDLNPSYTYLPQQLEHVPTSGGAWLAAIGLDLDVASRFDFIVGYDPSLESLMHIASKTLLAPAVDDPIDSLRAHQIRHVVARIIDAIPIVEIPNSLRGYLEQNIISRLTTEMNALLALGPARSFITRTAYSIEKITIAHARANMRPVAIQQDADVAIAHLDKKLAFLATFQSGPPTTSGKPEMEHITFLLRKRFGGGSHISIDDARNYLEEELDIDLRATKDYQRIRRILNTNSDQTKNVRGMYSVKTLPPWCVAPRSGKPSNGLTKEQADDWIKQIGSSPSLDPKSRQADQKISPT